MSKREDVGLLHRELSRLGFRIASREIETAAFGPTTRQAVLDFQNRHGLRTTGAVEMKTAEAINEAVDALPWFTVRGTVHPQERVKAFDRPLRREELFDDEISSDQRTRRNTHSIGQWSRAHRNGGQ